METLVIDNTNFVKASKIARDYGYTSDYIGQLCRSQKVSAKLVGRTWYVNPDSLTDHKSTRYKKLTLEANEPKRGYAVELHQVANQNTVAKHEEPLGLSTVKEKANKETPGNNTNAKRAINQANPSPDRKSFYRRLPPPKLTSQYSGDESELIPVVKKTGEAKSHDLAITLADAKEVAVTATTSEYALKAPPRPKISFTGHLSLKEIPEEEPIEIPEEAEMQNPQVIQVAKVVQPLEKPEPHALVKPLKTGKITTKRTLNNENKESHGTVAIDHYTRIKVEDRNISVHPQFIAVSAVAAACIAFVLIATQVTVISNTQSSVERMNFTVELLAGLINGLK